MTGSLQIQQNVPLAPLTTLGIGGPARYFTEARDCADIGEAFAFAVERQLPVFVLGGGSNIVVSDQGYSGLVLRIALCGVLEEKPDWAGDSTVVLTAAAGEPWDGFVAHTVAAGLAGIECLSGIPGTVGGTPIQNVGAYGQEVSETILSVQAWDTVLGRLTELRNAQCGFSYRQSAFSTSLRGRYVIVAVTFALRPGGAPALRYAELRQTFAAPPSLAEVREAVLLIRARKAMVIVPGDPDSRSVGSFFKNPILPVEQFEQIVSGFPEELVPSYPAPGHLGQVKMAAAWLIEHAGFHRGYARGKAGISTRHTLALVNRGGATAVDIVALMHEIRDTVRARFGIELAPEPQFIGFSDGLPGLAVG